MVRGTQEQETLRSKAKELVSGKEGIKLADEETTGQNDFKYRKYPSVCGVVVDKGSDRGFVQVSGGNEETKRVDTGRGDTGFTFVEISEGQTCMLYGEPTAISPPCTLNRMFNKKLAHFARYLNRWTLMGIFWNQYVIKAIRLRVILKKVEQIISLQRRAIRSRVCKAVNKVQPQFLAS
ncbi:hypothetical protein T440DRAFT_511851 [Plenodomus tracheiphilus IPT5]|uniref:Uncharacterized protein n=1 Tax=Plenodomus tracheiphilus IPT5 TaxID=1408161 RepID=A0A6A7AP25_9PLEO|nr:hypothetical protein T440DRAFT_511851 [Plenodomus tracheiphilus IPT5]